MEAPAGRVCSTARPAALCRRRTRVATRSAVAANPHSAATHRCPTTRRRKEVKDYGTKKAIEGAFSPGQRCLIVEDLVTSGMSVQETVEPLEASAAARVGCAAACLPCAPPELPGAAAGCPPPLLLEAGGHAAPPGLRAALTRLCTSPLLAWPQKEGLKVSDVVVLIDREQGGRARLASQGLRLHSAFTLTYILDTLLRHGLVTDDVAAKVKQFVADNQTDQPGGLPAAAAAAPPAPKRCAQ